MHVMHEIRVIHVCHLALVHYMWCMITMSLIQALMYKNLDVKLWWKYSFKERKRNPLLWFFCNAFDDKLWAIFLLMKILDSWDSLVVSLINSLDLTFDGIRGFILKTMYSTIQATLSNIQMLFGPSTHKWIGFFSPFDVFIRARAYIGEKAFMTFDVHDDGMLSFYFLFFSLKNISFH